MDNFNRKSIEHFGVTNIDMDIDTPHAHCDQRLGRLQTMLDCYFIKKYILSSLSKDRIGNLSILDVGAGKGRMTKEFIKIAKTCVAVEPFPHFFNFLKSHFENIEIYPYTLKEYIKFADKKFDIIFISGVICYLDDDELTIFLKNAKQLLKDDGFVLIRDLCPYKNWEKDAKFMIIRSSKVLISFIKRAGFNSVYCHRAYPINIPYKLYSSWPNRLTNLIWEFFSHRTMYPLWQMLANINLLPHKSKSYLYYLVKIK